MSGFDYANARLRALKSRLLPRGTLEALAETDSAHNLMLALMDTPYRAAVQTALAQAPTSETSAPALAEALRLELLNTLGRVRAFFSPNDEAGRLAILALRRFDVHNLKAVLRGLVRQIPTADILASTMPVGELGTAELALLARAPHVSAMLDLLATWRIPLARPWLEWRARATPSGLADLARMETSLERWHLRTALEAAQAAGPEGAALCEALRREADAMNIMIALRLVGAGERLPTEVEVFVGPGLVPVSLVSAAALQPAIVDAVRAWEPTPYGPALQGALVDYEHNRRLSAFERALTRLEQRTRLRQAIEDALGIGILLAYMALKTNEVADLRAIASGIAFGEKPETLRAGLLVAD
jgi:V/A-type H+-transporting ATPase subunit C